MPPHKNGAAGIPRSFRGPLRQSQWQDPLATRLDKCSAVCAGEYVGLEEIDEGIWNVPSNWVVFWSGTVVLRMRMVECCAANKCYLCPTTFLLPLSPPSVP